MFYRETTTLATHLFFVCMLLIPPFHLLNFSVLVEQNNSEWPVSAVRLDGASGWVRWQHWKIQAPECFFSGQVEWAAFF